MIPMACVLAHVLLAEYTDDMVQIQFPYVSHLNLSFAENDKLKITYLLSQVNTLYLKNI